MEVLLFFPSLRGVVTQNGEGVHGLLVQVRVPLFAQPATGLVQVLVQDCNGDFPGSEVGAHAPLPETHFILKINCPGRSLHLALENPQVVLPNYELDPR
jgi:hypothetical protein